MARFDISDFLPKGEGLDDQHLADDVRDLLLLELEATQFGNVRPNGLREKLDDLCKAYRCVLDHDWHNLDQGGRERRRNWCTAATRRLNDLMHELKREPQDVPGLEAFEKLEMRILAFMADKKNMAR